MPDREHDHHDLAQRLAELVVLARAREARELREQRGLHGLEAEQRDARDQDAGRELADRDPSARGVASTTAAMYAEYESAWQSTEPSEQVPDRGRELGVRRFRSGLEQVLLAAQRDEHRGDRRQHEREPVRARRAATPTMNEHGGRDEADDAFGAEHRAVRRRSGRCPASVPRAM